MRIASTIRTTGKKGNSLIPSVGTCRGLGLKARVKVRTTGGGIPMYEGASFHHFSWPAKFFIFFLLFFALVPLMLRSPVLFFPVIIGLSKFKCA
uniref:Uncharacterized protein n=1 Tax=Arundo donax TaxID=35708 RepID=A0A0A9EVE0_ARUDO